MMRQQGTIATRRWGLIGCTGDVTNGKDREVGRVRKSLERGKDEHRGDEGAHKELYRVLTPVAM